MAEERELTPEEKLLKVIQDGDAPIQDGDNVSGHDGGSEQERREPSGGLPLCHMRAFNMLFVLVTLLALGLSGYEVYRSRPESTPEFKPMQLDLSGSRGSQRVPSMGQVIDMFDVRRIFGKPPERIKGGEGKEPEPFKGWRAYVRDNLQLTGRSTVIKQTPDGGSEKVLEAIVMDNKVKKMHFLSVGMKIRILDKDVEVDKIGDKTLTLKYGEEKIEIGVPKGKGMLPKMM